MDETAREHAIEHTRQFLGGRTDRLQALFLQFPSLAAWLVTHSLSREYGDDDHAVYPHIADTLRVPLDTPPQRNILFNAFCGVCDRFGLPTQGFDRRRLVDVYLLHAGVSQAQLPHLIDAFLRQETAFGPPPVETTVLLNRWEDDALDFLPPAVSVPRRAILWDETAWHATLFARIRKDPEAFVPTIEFEECFKDVFDQQLNIPQPIGGNEVLAPRPRLSWQSGGLVLRLPRSEGRIRLWLDGAQRPLRLRGGEDWTLPQPWPHEIRWEISNQADQLKLLAHEGCVVFDRITGHQLREIPPSSADIELDSTDIAILARAPFSINSESALESGPESFVGFAGLGPRPVVFSLGKVQISLRARPRRRLSLAGDEIANGPRGTLHGPSAKLRIETGLGRSETRAIRVTLGLQSWLVQTEISEDGFGEIEVKNLLAGFADESGDPLRLQVELMAPNIEGSTVHSSGIRLSAWIWPAFRGSDGIVFQSEGPVRNLVQEKCLYVGRDGRERLCLDPAGGYSVARAVFEIEGEHVPFDLPWPDVTVTRHRAKGSVSPLPLGTRLSIGEDDRFDTISIRCPDLQAQLIIRGRREAHPFHGQLTRSLAVRDLLVPASDERVLLRRGTGVEVLLFELVAAFAPKGISFLPAHNNAVRLRLHFNEDVDAVAAEIEDETGAVVFAEAALRYRPVATRRPDWFHAEVCNNDTSGIELTFDVDWLDNGPRLARLLIRPDGRDGWRPLRNARGDSFAVALINPIAEGIEHNEKLSRRFDTLCRWLSDCYATECWQTLNRAVVPRWRELGRKLHALPSGDGAVMRAACLPPPDHAAPGWVSILHPLQFLPELYAAPPRAFASLAISIDQGVAEMAALAMLNTARLRELSHLHPTVYLAFRNRQDAHDNDVRLEGFNPALFFKNLPLVDGDPSAGWFWRGAPLLGPDHWRAAHLRLVERLDAASLFIEDTVEEGPNSRRQESLQRLMYAAWASAPENQRPPAPYRSQDADEPAQVDLWATALLSGFARASRLDDVTNYVETVSQRAGMSTAKVLTSIAFMLRLAPELFAFHLLLWQIAKERP